MESQKGRNTSDSHETLRRQSRLLRRQVGFCGFGLILLGVLTLGFALGMGNRGPKIAVLDPVYHQDYSIDNLPDKPSNREIKLGYEIFRYTSRFLGPEQPDSTRQFAGNRLACANCHLDAGTRPFSAPLIGVIQRFPQFRGRENKIGTIEERINGCMERSMNGRVIPDSSVEMRAMIAYFNWLGRMAPADGKIAGSGFAALEIPDRAVDLNNGQRVFEQHCVVCHGADGEGIWAGGETGYTYPPLWGEDSYNNGAGMTRVITAAEFIKANMPFGTTTYDRPTLTDEEAYDVAGYINFQHRPEKPNKEIDFPDLTKKPVSAPYGPFADPFPLAQHQFGPFQPIMEYYKKEFNINKSK